MPNYNPPAVISDEDRALCDALDEAAIRFRGRGTPAAARNADIAQDIARRTRVWGRFASLRQRQYAESLVRWSQPVQGPVATQAQHVQAEEGTQIAEARSALRETMSPLALQRIAQLFATAATHGLRRPKIRLQRGEWRIVMYPAPSTGRHPGDIYVRASSGTGRRMYCGRISQESGMFFASNDCPLDVQIALREFSANPEEVARAYGRMTSHCCFCGLGLTDSRSVAMGYGPICAGHYGLPWGDQRQPEVHVTFDEAAALQRAMEDMRERSNRAMPREPVRISNERAPEGYVPADGRTMPRNLTPELPPLGQSEARRRELADRLRREAERVAQQRRLDEDEDQHFM